MAREAKTPLIRDQQLKVQEVCVRAADTGLYVVDGGDVVIIVGEELSAVVSAQFHDNSGPALTSVIAANRIISDSTAYTAAGDAKAVRLNGVAALDANDHVILKYIVA